MAQADEELTVAQRLGHLLDRGLLPAGGPAEAAERLIERLERPARVALLGLPGSGKSAILNLLTGSSIVPETLRLPTIIVQYGSEERMVCTLSDGKTQVVPGRDLSDVLTLNPALVTLEADLPALKVISLLEVSAGPMDAEQRRAATWASKRADVLIWCTTSYLPKEQQVWESMPDVVKDNGFLFLTKVDLLGSHDAARGMLERVELRAGEEFRQVLAISAKQARAAMPPGGPVDRELFRDSGAAAVITTIKNRVQMAQRADTDMAELLLARHVEAGGVVARRFAEDSTLRRDPAPEWTPPLESKAEVVTAKEPEPERLPEAEIFHLPKGQPVPVPDEAPVDVPDEVAEAAEEPAPVVAPEPEPQPESEPEPEPEPELEQEPEIYPALEILTEPDAVQAPEPEPTFLRRSEPEREPDTPSGSGRRRFSDRIKQMPMPDDAAAQPLVPLRSTWKSKAETAAAAAARGKAEPPPAAPPPEPVEIAAPKPAPEPPAARQPLSEVLRPRPGIAVPDPDDVSVAAMLAAIEAAPEQGAEEATDDLADVAPAEAPAEAPDEATDERADEATEETAGESAEEAADGPLRAERPMPTDSTPLAARSARTQLFGSRKPAITSPANVKPAEKMVRTGEPVTRVRAPAPRAPEPPRPAAPLPEELATPRMAMMRDRPVDGGTDSAPLRSERRERPRIARAAAAAPAPAAPMAGIAPVASVDQDVLGAAIRMIVARSVDLAGAVEPSAKVPVDMVLEHCRDTTEQVIDIVSRGESADLRRIKGDLSQIQDLIMLMLLEKGHAPADDALTLLLQIRRDLETLRGV